MQYGVWRFNKMTDGTWTQQLLGVRDSMGAALRMWSVCEAAVPAEMLRKTRWMYYGEVSADDDELPADTAWYRLIRPTDRLCVLR